MTAPVLDLAAATPTAVDTALAAIHQQLWKAEQRQRAARDSIHRAAGDRQTRHRGRSSWTLSYAEALEAATATAENGRGWPAEVAGRALAALAAADQAVTELYAEQDRHDAEWRRRRWSRVYVAQPDRGIGHAHHGTGCSTCHNGPQRTRLILMPQWSGATEEQIVEDAGERACTTCYPSAPVDVRKRRTRMFTPDEIEAQQARQAREARGAQLAEQRAAKAITNPDGTPLRVTGETLETLHRARIWLTDTHDGWRNPRPADDIDRVAAAIAAKENKLVDQVLKEAQQRAARRK
jgi:hypothetical protein